MGALARDSISSIQIPCLYFCLGAAMESIRGGVAGFYYTPMDLRVHRRRLPGWSAGTGLFF